MSLALVTTFVKTKFLRSHRHWHYSSTFYMKGIFIDNNLLTYRPVSVIVIPTTALMAKCTLQPIWEASSSVLWLINEVFINLKFYSALFKPFHQLEFRLDTRGILTQLLQSDFSSQSELVNLLRTKVTLKWCYSMTVMQVNLKWNVATSRWRYDTLHYSSRTRQIPVYLYENEENADSASTTAINVVVHLDTFKTTPRLWIAQWHCV